jgi:hypothetical protein
MARLWRGEILVWQYLWIKWGIVSKIFPLKALAVQLVFLGKLITLGRIESVKFADCLRSESPCDLPEKELFEPALTQAGGRSGPQ